MTSKKTKKTIFDLDQFKINLTCTNHVNSHLALKNVMDESWS
ncbi:MAG: hypothetical protein ACTSXP_12110 [Promethearchaeota archaeon]